MTGIYKITSPSGKIYIGQSIDILKRKKNYSNKTCRGQVRLYRSIQKYGYKNHKFEVIEECDMDQLNEREILWQEFYKSTSNKGLNCLLVKTSTKKAVFSKETRLKMSESRKGKKFSEEHKIKISMSQKGRVFSKETIDKMRKSRVGFKHSKESVEKIRKNSTGRIMSKSGRLKCRNAKLDKVTREVLNTETGIFYNNTTAAAFSLNMNMHTLRMKLKIGGKRNNTSMILI